MHVYIYISVTNELLKIFALTFLYGVEQNICKFLHIYRLVIVVCMMAEPCLRIFIIIAHCNTYKYLRAPVPFYT